MKWLRFIVILLILYGTTGQQLYSGSHEVRSKAKNANSAKDARIIALSSYLEKKGSPLVESSSTFIRVADASGLDWTLLPAIAGVESGFETNGNVYDFNPFGYMCGELPCVFNSYKDAIQQVAETLARGRAYENYRNTRSTLELAKTYNYVHPEDWTDKVEYFQREIR